MMHIMDNIYPVIINFDDIYNEEPVKKNLSNMLKLNVKGRVRQFELK